MDSLSTVRNLQGHLKLICVHRCNGRCPNISGSIFRMSVHFSLVNILSYMYIILRFLLSSYSATDEARSHNNDGVAAQRPEHFS